jgi:hypothetical protein
MNFIYLFVYLLCNVDILHGQAESTCNMDNCSMDTHQGDMDMEHGHEAKASRMDK